MSDVGLRRGRRSGIRVSVPASTANLGPGFDVLGLALELLDVFDVWEVGSEVRIEVDGEGAESVPTDDSNLFFSTMHTYFTLAGYRPAGLIIREHNHIPLARGLGSSAATIVGALLAARAISRYAMEDDRLLDLAASLEGHPDNVGVALLGGFQMVASEGGGRYLARRLEYSERLGVAVFVPELLISTESARDVLPEAYARADVVHNLGRLALLLSAIREGRFEDLRAATEDRLHQPYRAELVPGFADMLAAATMVGAAGVFLSGAGPTILALYDRAVPGLGAGITEAIAGAAENFGLEGRRMVLGIREQGAEVSVLARDPAPIGPPA